MKRLVIACDHHGFGLKQALLAQTTYENIEVAWLDVGCSGDQRTDYPLFARHAVRELLSGTVEGGILLCGTGVGMAIAANRFRGVYAALVWCPEVARRAKEEDNANLICLPADYLSVDHVRAIMQQWLLATFQAGRYQERLLAIDQDISSAKP